MKKLLCSNILTWYLAREFLKTFAIFCLVLLGVVYLFDVIELLRRAAGKEGISLLTILSMGLYKLPEAGQEIIPFITLFSGMACLWSLTQRRELVSLRAAGLSVWQFLMPLISTTLILGLLFLTVIHPITAFSLSRYNALEAYYYDNRPKTISVIEDGLWLRQTDDTGNLILKAGKLNALTWELDDVTVFFFDNKNRHTQRIDADKATLAPQEWRFEDVQVQRTGDTPASLPSLSLSTTLTRENLTESFSDPRTISFWALPYFIHALDQTGLDTSGMKIYYQSLLAQPLLLVAMIFLSGAASLRTARMSKLMPVVAIGLVAGLGVFLLSGFLRALGQAGELPIILAAWSAPLILIFCAIATLLKLEDG